MNNQPKLLDLFCGAMGAGYGYMQCGFSVTGVDHKPQPNIPEGAMFIQSDVMDVLRDMEFLKQFDAIHASPPCQGYSTATKEDSKYVHYSQGKQTPQLIAPVREALVLLGKPYVIENVMGARNQMINPVMLRGYMFGLPIDRKRLFETNFSFIAPPLREYISSKQWAAENNVEYRDMSVTGKSRRAGCIETWKRITGNHWMKRAHEIAESIPWKYTEYVGSQMIKYIK